MSARDVLLIPIIVFVVAIAFFIMHFAVNTMVTEITSHPEVSPVNASVEAFDKSAELTNRGDYIVFGMFIALVFALIVTGYLIGGYPIFMFFYFLFVVISVILSAVFGNVWEQITQSATFGTTIASFPITNHIILYLPLYATVIGFIGIVVMFAKPYFQQGYE
jgi:hypothetical protein